MAQDPNVAALIKIVARHDKVLGLLAEAMAEQAHLLHSLLPKCTNGVCENTATMYHISYEKDIMCDRCTAETITSNTSDPYGLKSLSNEQLWSELVHADKIRRLEKFIEALGEGKVPVEQ